MIGFVKRAVRVLAQAPCPWGCYKQFKNGQWVCVTCGN